jgi:hypothetical protein
LEIIMSSLHSTSLVKRFLAAALCSASLGALAHSNWAAVGSVGTVDEASAARHEFSGAWVNIKSGLVGTNNAVTLRYYVVDTFGANGRFVVPALNARFRDNGAGARVTLSLRGYHKTTGASVAVVPLLDSDAFPASGLYQTQSAFNCSGSMDFNSHVYYIEATLTRLDSTGIPSLGWVGVEPYFCTDAADAPPN